MKQQAYALIGRLQGPHPGHKEIIRHAIRNTDGKVIIALGSADIARDPENPWTFEERSEMVERIVNDILQEEPKKITLSIIPLHDYIYDNTKWLGQAYGKIKAHLSDNEELVLTGCKKDESSSYIDFFQCKKDLIEVQENGLGATDLRKVFFESGSIPPGWYNTCKTFMESFRNRPEYQQLKAEYDFNKAYVRNATCNEFYDANGNRIETLYDADGNEVTPNQYPPKYITSDAVVTCAGHVLLVRRGKFPGKGLLALPGGHLENYETPEAGVIRELREETRLKVPPGVLSKVEGNVTVFADPNRSLRGRTVTHCGYIVIHDKDLPKVKGSDDAEWAGWVPIHELPSMRDQFFEDHYSILATYFGHL